MSNFLLLIFYLFFTSFLPLFTSFLPLSYLSFTTLLPLFNLFLPLFTSLLPFFLPFFTFFYLSLTLSYPSLAPLSYTFLELPKFAPYSTPDVYEAACNRLPDEHLVGSVLRPRSFSPDNKMA